MLKVALRKTEGPDSESFNKQIYTTVTMHWRCTATVLLRCRQKEECDLSDSPPGERELETRRGRLEAASARRTAAVVLVLDCRLPRQPSSRMNIHDVILVNFTSRNLMRVAEMCETAWLLPANMPAP
jgi:hypothetical protein